MSMSMLQYYRIEDRAGGVVCTEREFVRACHTVLNKDGRSRENREWRHAWIRAGLAHRESARALYHLF